MPFSAAKPLTGPADRVISVQDGPGLCAVLQGLYEQQLGDDPGNEYLIEHSAPRCIDNQVRTFQWYNAYLPPSGAILDWGCRHAPDSCLLRAAHGRRFQLFGCDFTAPDCHRPFYEFADLSYTQLDDTVALPYENRQLDAVIGSGVLEHVATDYESLKEVNRILKPDGVLIISYLPNWLSFQEWFLRVVRRRGFHRRLYGWTEASQLLKRAGFYPANAGYHSYFWERSLAKIGIKRGSFPTRLMTRLHWFSPTLRFVAHKVAWM
jgi:SAM-dependent methyltransferase